ncbi:glycosyltransferase family 4 protein [Dietzia kunjamensis]|uniref:glycosyltransferase family 4 protein n=1 Tax=Dietzia kunjamensis TaxID=322509 RepID=UPI002097CE00|nr:glycosyltransferase family 4 protein [Dietzia kunjamensis]USX47392.1 glycosyltransferase family 4 protein [Dietzia kunjamensis]
MRILHLVNELVDTGNGIVNVAVDLAIDCAARGDEVAIASSGGGFVELVVTHGVRHVDIDFRNRPARSFGRLRRWVREFRPDVVHAHTAAPCAIAAAVRRSPGVPDFVLVATMHNVYQRSSVLMATADMTIGVAESVSRTVRRRRWHSPLVETVVNGVVSSPRRPKRGIRSEDDGAVLGPESIVTVGAVSHRKGADVLLDAFIALAGSRPGAHLWYVGNTDWADVIQRARSSEFADRIHFPGLSTDPGSFLAAATVVAVPSRREGLALALLEARETCAAIVATDTDGSREGLDQGAAGILVPVEEPEALASALVRVLDNPQLRSELRGKAAAGLERFSVGRMAADYRDCYMTAAAGRQPTRNR